METRIADANHLLVNKIVNLPWNVSRIIGVWLRDLFGEKSKFGLLDTSRWMDKLITRYLQGDERSIYEDRKTFKRERAKGFAPYLDDPDDTYDCYEGSENSEEMLGNIHVHGD